MIAASTTRRWLLAFTVPLTGCETQSRMPLVPSARVETSSQSTPRPISRIDYAYFRRAWAVAGRRWLETNGGVKRSDTQTGWHLEPTWPHRDQTAMKAYAIAYATIAGAHASLVCNDQELRRELAGFYDTYRRRFSRLDTLRGETGYDKSVLDDGASGATQVLRWVDRVGGRERLRECEVCSAQFLYGPALLMRVVASAAPHDRSDMEATFVREYLPLIVRDHLLRPDNDAFGPSMVATMLGQFSAEHQRYSDRDLLMLATGIEVLHAAQLDPELVGLAAEDRDAILQIVLESLRQLRTWARPSTVDGRATISFFEGMYADRAEYSFAGYEGARFPGEHDAKTVASIGWDSGHYHRVALALWSAWQGREVIGSQAPTRSEVAATAAQFTRVIWNGDTRRPNFSNFSTGHDGWFRVGRGRDGFGYPPSRYCDSRNDDRPCDLRMSALGWGLLHRSQPEIIDVYDALFDLALSNDAQRIEYRRRAATYLGEELALRDTSGEEAYPTLLLFWLGVQADRLAGCDS